jgi:hypothetical protein
MSVIKSRKNIGSETWPVFRDVPRIPECCCPVTKKNLIGGSE